MAKTTMKELEERIAKTEGQLFCREVGRHIWDIIGFDDPLRSLRDRGRFVELRKRCKRCGKVVRKSIRVSRRLRNAVATFFDGRSD